MWLIAAHRPKVVVELGVHTGNSFFAFCQTVQDEGIDSKCFGVDTWEGDKHAETYDETVWNDVSAYMRLEYGDIATPLRMTFDDAVDQFEDNSIDLLHIDGLHTYEAVKNDFETWLPKLSPRAIVLFHDIAETRDDFGVYQFWAEIAGRYPSISFDHSHGLGVLCFGPDSRLSLDSLLAATHNNSPNLPSILDAFAHAGLGLQRQWMSAASAAPFVDADKVKLKLYFGHAPELTMLAAYSEAQSARAMLSLDGRLARLDIPFPLFEQRLVSLRLDPADHPCVITIQEIELISSEGLELWAAKKDAPLTGMTPELLPDSQRSPWRLLCTGDDAHFVLPIPHSVFESIDASGVGARLRMRCAAQPYSSYATAEIGSALQTLNVLSANALAARNTEVATVISANSSRLAELEASSRHMLSDIHNAVAALQVSAAVRAGEDNGALALTVERQREIVTEIGVISGLLSGLDASSKHSLSGIYDAVAALKAATDLSASAAIGEQMLTAERHTEIATGISENSDRLSEMDAASRRALSDIHEAVAALQAATSLSASLASSEQAQITSGIIGLTGLIDSARTSQSQALASVSEMQAGSFGALGDTLSRLMTLSLSSASAIGNATSEAAQRFALTAERDANHLEVLRGVIDRQTTESTAASDRFSRQFASLAAQAEDQRVVREREWAMLMTERAATQAQLEHWQTLSQSTQRSLEQSNREHENAERALLDQTDRLQNVMSRGWVRLGLKAGFVK